MENPNPLYSLSLIERKINDPKRLLACKTATAISNENSEWIIKESIIFKNTLACHCGVEANGPQYYQIIVDPLMPSSNLWADVVVKGIGFELLPDKLEQLVEQLKGAMPPKVCVNINALNSLQNDRTIIIRRVCLKRLAELFIAAYDGCRKKLFLELFEDPEEEMGDGLRGILARSSISIECLIDDFFAVDTYSKALLLVELFSAKLEERRDVTLRIYIVDILSPELCQMKRTVKLIRNKLPITPLSADSDGQLLSIERILDHFLWPATRKFDSIIKDRLGEKGLEEEIYNILNKGSKKRKINNITSATSYNEDCIISIDNIRVQNHRLESIIECSHYLLFPAFDTARRQLLFFLKPRREVIARVLLPGLFRHKGQFLHGPCLTQKEIGGRSREKDWYYSLADYSPVRQLTHVDAFVNCTTTVAKRPVVLPFYF